MDRWLGLTSCEGSVFIDDVAVGERSPPWETYDRHESPPSATRSLASGVEGDGGDPPPLSQAKATGPSVADQSAPTPEVRAIGGTGGVATPSTLSDDAASTSALELESFRRQGRSGSRSTKRTTSTGAESEEHDTVEEGQDIKRKPRKSARLA